MDTFTYLAGIATLIIGLAIAKLLQGLADLTEERQRVRFDWLPVVWIAHLLISAAYLWWLLFRWREFDNWTFGHFCFLLAQPAALYYLSSILLPRFDGADTIDLAAHFESIRKYFFILLGVYMWLDLVDTLLKGVDHFMSLGPYYPIAIVTYGLIWISGAFIRRRAYQIFLVIFLPASLIVWYCFGTMSL